MESGKNYNLKAADLLTAAYEKFWISTGRKKSLMKNFGEGQRKPRCPCRSNDGNGIGQGIYIEGRK